MVSIDIILMCQFSFSLLKNFLGAHLENLLLLFIWSSILLLCEKFLLILSSLKCMSVKLQASHLMLLSEQKLETQNVKHCVCDP